MTIERKITPSSFLFGAAYYPEHDRTDDLDDDPDRLAAAGVNIVRMAEFAWDLMEPRPGEFHFELFDEHINRLGARGIKTLLCTPTATPPVWLARAHPEILRVDAHGRRQMHGSRQHASHCSPVFRAACRKITQAMAEHFSTNAHVEGWQTDNEFHCHFSEDYSDAAQKGFRDHLRLKYGHIEELNEAWGTRFWGQTYCSFDEIDPPYPNRPSQENPGQRLDYLLYLSAAVKEFQDEQITILRSANSRWWITHNGIFANIDYHNLSKNLDFMGVDVYPLLAAIVDPTQKSPEAYAARLLARTQSFTGRFIVPELQSGSGAQGDSMTDSPEPGQMRMFAWQCVAHGADGILHFRWRSCRFGAEEYWEGVLDHDNLPRRRYDEFSQEGREFARLGSSLLETKPRPDVGVLLDTGLMEFSHRPITHGLPSPGDVADSIFTSWWRAGYNVGYIHPLADLFTFKLLFLCSATVVLPSVVDALSEWVASGGTLVILPRCGRKDERGQVVATTPPGILTGLSGCVVDEYSRVNSARLAGSPTVTFTWGDETCHEHLWRDLLTERGGATIAKWRGGRFEGRPAVIKNGFGRGCCITIGTYPNASLDQQWMRKLAPMAGVTTLVPYLPEGVEVRARFGEAKRLLFFLNHRAEKKTIPFIPSGTELISGRTLLPGPIDLEPFGVTVVAS